MSRRRWAIAALGAAVAITVGVWAASQGSTEAPDDPGGSVDTRAPGTDPEEWDDDRMRNATPAPMPTVDLSGVADACRRHDRLLREPGRMCGRRTAPLSAARLRRPRYRMLREQPTGSFERDHHSRRTAAGRVAAGPTQGVPDPEVRTRPVLNAGGSRRNRAREYDPS